MPDSSPEIAFSSIRQLGAGLRDGSLDPVELTERSLDRLRKVGPTLNAVVTLTERLAIGQAKRARREFSQGMDRGPLHGIPYGAKDLLSTAGIPTSWGSAPYQEQVFDFDAAVVERLRDAGAVLVAKLAMVEIAGGMGYRQAHASFTGPGLNPWDGVSWSGGSSSGSGAAVGAGLVPFAIGSETWGSIMTPASYCGVTGLRPTYGRVSRRGAMALSWTMDKLGPIARTAEDCGLVLNAIAGHDPGDPSSVSRSYSYPETEEKISEAPFRFATIKQATSRVQPEVRANFETSLEVLKPYGTFEEIELPDLPYSSVASTLIGSEMSAAFDEFISSGDVWELTAPEDRFGGYAPQLIPAKDYLNAQRIRVHIQQALDQLFTRFDAVVTPTMTAVANPADQDFRAYFARYSGTAIGAAANAAGIPAITVPNGFGERGLPTGIKLVGRAFDENRLIAIASQYQKDTDWHNQHPSI